MVEVVWGCCVLVFWHMYLQSCAFTPGNQTHVCLSHYRSFHLSALLFDDSNKS